MVAVGTRNCSSPPAQIPACAANAPGSSLGSNVVRRAAQGRVRSGAQPPTGSTWQLGSVSEPRPPVGCFPWVRPFPPRPPQEVAFRCSVASSILRPHPTSHPRTCSAFGCCLHEPARLAVRARMRLPRFRAKNFPTCTRSPTARGSPHPSQYAMGDVAFSSAERDRHLGIRPVSQLNTWPVVSPVKRFTSALAGRRASLGVGVVGLIIHRRISL